MTSPTQNANVFCYSRGQVISNFKLVVKKTDNQEIDPNGNSPEFCSSTKAMNDVELGWS